ncbi:MAG: quinolinate synthase NadA [Gammaproteobacteria bacterium]|nr:quinolinate synthase NadA [Gammaproteobacteria bacterium]MBL6999222.1 quinolinate synthase NadA [Gammaproteobacteria bacterium]
MAANPIELQPYSQLSDEDCRQRIINAKRTLGERLVILGHHYQRDEIFEHADFSGDSLKLSRKAANSKAEFIVFCGVHFMAEVADILSRPDQISILPDLSAGCSMADMADLPRVEQAWKELSSVIDPDQTLTPVTYINSDANLKAFCGDHQGVVCTSTNAQKILEWSFSQREKVLFFPDQHLGRNTGAKMGLELDEMVVWDYDQPMGGLTEQQIHQAKIILWKGFCSVHQMFKPAQIENFRKQVPAGKVISHPESSYEVCQLSDYVGSTEFIINTIRDAEPGTDWLVGTELNLVNRLHQQMKDQQKTVKFMSPTVCMCSTMFRIDPQHLAWVLENLVENNVVNQISVPTKVAKSARVALQRMLAISI